MALLLLCSASSSRISAEERRANLLRMVARPTAAAADGSSESRCESAPPKEAAHSSRRGRWHCRPRACAAAGVPARSEAGLRSLQCCQPATQPQWQWQQAPRAVASIAARMNRRAAAALRSPWTRRSHWFRCWLHSSLPVRALQSPSQCALVAAAVAVAVAWTLASAAEAAR